MMFDVFFKVTKRDHNGRVIFSISLKILRKHHVILDC